MGADTPPAGAAAEFTTDFARLNVDYSEILSGGLPKDGLPAITSLMLVHTAALFDPRKRSLDASPEGDPSFLPLSASLTLGLMSQMTRFRTAFLPSL